jgi:hypothetical protein
MAGARRDITSVGDFLAGIGQWRRRYMDARVSSDSIWYRGHSDVDFNLEPGVYRDNFTRASRSAPGRSAEDRRMHLEKEINSEFKRRSTVFFEQSISLVDLYFIQQHHGLPTRLLDWTTNALAALFFAAVDQPESDGAVLIMDARRVLPKPPRSAADDFPRTVVSSRHPYVQATIRELYWGEPCRYRSMVLPVLPDLRTGRIFQQSSCFTLHMRGQPKLKNPTLQTFIVPKQHKARLVRELRQLNVNRFTVYFDLDNLSSDIREMFDLSDPDAAIIHRRGYQLRPR